MATAVHHFVGLDLGQHHEFTALAVLERPRGSPHAPRGQPRPAYALRHLHRFPPGTPYPDIARTLRTLLQTPPLPGALVGVDQTGVGQAVRELVAEELAGRVWCTFAPVTVVAGVGSVGSAPGCGLLAPKVELVGTLQVLLQTRRLRIADALPESGVLAREMAAFRTNPPVLRGESVEAWREREHDDLVLAVAVAAWLGELSWANECGG